MTSPEARENPSKAAHGQKFVKEAPITIVACSTESERVMPCSQDAYTVDLSIAVSFMILEATELGLGTCWLGAYNEEQAKKVLEIPNNIRVPAMFTLGYADENPEPRPRRPTEDIICYEKFQ